MHFDLVVLGTGGAGFQAAMACRKAGWQVAAVDKGPFGGTCAVRGCVPKKVLAGTAQVQDLSRRLARLGVVTNPLELDWAETIRLKRSFTDDVPDSTRSSLEEAGIAVFEGDPHFTAPLTLEVAGETLSAKKIHIATGAEPAKLPFEGSEHLATSDDFLELPSLPRRIVFVGAGYVSLEFAHVAARFGSEVTLLEAGDRPLPAFDPDIVHALLGATEDIGIRVERNAPVRRITSIDGRYIVEAEGKGSFEADLVVHGAGRVPAISRLNLEATGVAYDARKGIHVDAHLRSVSNPNVFAAGDAADAGPPLSSVASVQGGIVAENLLGGSKQQPSYLSTPSVIFTTPHVAKVGYLEQEAEEEGLAFDAVTRDTSAWFDSMRLGLKHARSKVLVEKGSHRILGAHIIGNHADDLINIMSLAIHQGLTTDQLMEPIFAFPTSSDDLRSMF